MPVKRNDELRDQAMQLKLTGATYREIGEALNISRQRAQQITRPPRAIYIAVQKRANRQCEMCGLHVINGHVHHINDMVDRDFYNDLANLKYLCIACHRHEHGEPHEPKPLDNTDSGVACEHCGYHFTVGQVAQLLRSIKSEARAKASKANGSKGGRPRTLPREQTDSTSRTVST